jgi:hypothetical protein
MTAPRALRQRLLLILVPLVLIALLLMLWPGLTPAREKAAVQPDLPAACNSCDARHKGMTRQPSARNKDPLP